MKKEQLIEVYFDGGCGPTNPGMKYGSFSVSLNGVEAFRESRFPLGFGTNNEAEFESLLNALQKVRVQLIAGGLSEESFSIRLYSDSTIVVNRLNGRNRTNRSEPQRRMFALTVRCLEFLKHFASVKVSWYKRENNVARFGH